MSKSELTLARIKFLREAMSAETKVVDLRLREGEYQYDLAKTIAVFLIELRFPNVKELIERLYGKEKASDVQFVRKVQTVLKKMERRGIVRVLPKDRPWEMQGYSLLSFKFQDAERSLIILATEEKIRRLEDLLATRLNEMEISQIRLGSVRRKAYVLALVSLIVVSYAAILYAVLQPLVDLLILVPAFLVAIMCSIATGRVLSK